MALEEKEPTHSQIFSFMEKLMANSGLCFPISAVCSNDVATEIT